MADSIRIQDLKTEEIAELLAAKAHDLTEELARARHEFIEHIGGIENACNAVEMLSQLDKST